MDTGGVIGGGGPGGRKPRTRETVTVATSLYLTLKNKVFSNNVVYLVVNALG